MRTLFLLIFSMIPLKTFAQTDNTKSLFTVSLYSHLYYCYDSGNPQNHDRPSYFYSNLAVAVRGEYYNEENGIIIATGNPNGFQTSAYSFNLDYKLIENAIWQEEFRGLSCKDDIFLSDNTPTSKNYFVTTSLAIAS
jgi:hypothetical protein